MELNEIRPFLLGTLDAFHQLMVAEAGEQQTRSRLFSSLPIATKSSSNLFSLSSQHE